jgi:hypothetical protein
MRLNRQLVRMKPAHFASPWEYFCNFENLINQQDRTGFPLEDHAKSELFSRGVMIICGRSGRVMALLGRKGLISYASLLDIIKDQFRKKRQHKCLKPRKRQLSVNHYPSVTPILPWHH